MGGLMDARASSVAKHAKELDPGKAVKSGGPRGRCLKISLPAERQPGPDLGRRSGGGDHIDPGSAARSSGGVLLHAGHNMISGYPHIGLMPLVRVVCQRPLLSRIHSTGSGPDSPL